MKRKSCILLAFLLVMMLVACGKQPSEDANEIGNETTTVQTTTATTTASATTTTAGATSATESTTTAETTTAPATQAVEPPNVEQQNVVTFQDLNKTMYSLGNPVNVRASWSTSSELLGSIPYGGEVKVTGYDSSVGFYRVDYNGGVAYIAADYLSDTKPQEQQPNPQPNPNPQPTQAPQPQPEPQPDPQPQPDYEILGSEYINGVLKGINDLRATVGISAATLDSTLSNECLAQAKKMAEAGHTFHSEQPSGCEAVAKVAYTMPAELLGNQLSKHVIDLTCEDVSKIGIAVVKSGNSLFVVAIGLYDR